MSDALQDRVRELAAEVAELSQTVASLAAKVKASGEIGADVRELLQVLREQKPQAAPIVNIPPMPPAPEPRVTVEGTIVNLPGAEGVEVVHEWGMEMGHFVPLRSIVKRKAKG